MFTMVDKESENIVARSNGLQRDVLEGDRSN